MTEIQPIRVVIVDDQALVRTGLKLFLMAFDDHELVGEAASGEEAIRICCQLQPDVVLMDLAMPGIGGAAATTVIREQCPQVQVIALTNFQDVDMVQQALRAGAIGYLIKNVTADELACAIRAAHAGRPTLAPEATQALVQATHESASPAPGVPSSLTPREQEVLALMAKGLSNPEIAERLTVSTVTVKFHVSNILLKLGCTSRTEAVALAVQQRLIPFESGA
jgi:NarL family two-component system response regulator LiaR